MHAVLTDVTVEKRSRRIIRFIPVPEAEEPDSGGPLDVMQPAPPPPVGGAMGPADEVSLGPKCQVIIMEYCNLGPLHHYVAEKRFFRQVDLMADWETDRPEGEVSF